MKKIILLFSLALFTHGLRAQVGINANGNNPNSSAMLDVSSNNKGLLIPRVSLLSGIDNTTIPNPATSLLVYNTNTGMSKGAGYYYNNGTPASPNWQPMHDLILPYYKGTSANGSAFTIENFSQNTASTAIRAVAGGAGNALEVSGKMKIAGAGQAPSQGKVLTSDANGNATWEGAVAFSVKGVVNTGSHVIAKNVDTKLRFASVKYDLTGSYSGPNAGDHSVFTAPVHGIYHFDVQVDWFGAFNETGAVDASIMRVSNGVKTRLFRQIRNPEGHAFVPCNINVDVELSAGEQVYVEVSHNVDDYLDVGWSETSSFFNGRLVIKLQ